MTTQSAASTRRILAASLVGTGIEFYDFYVYTTAAALVFGQLFFPSSDPAASQLLSFATIAVAFVARPLGSIFFGHFGDRIGRKSTLVASLLTMGLSTTLVAFLPTYGSIGWPAALILCILRFGQGFGLGGEWGGAALLAVENAPPGYRARYGMFPQLGAPVGFVAANGLFLILGILLTPAQFLAWGWRIPFAISAALVGVGMWIRLRLHETPAFARVLEEGPPPSVPLMELFASHGSRVVIGTLGAVACFVAYYIGTAFALGYGVKTLGYSMQTFLSIQLGAILFMAIGIVLAAYAADRHWDERRVLAGGCVAAMGLGFLTAPLLGGGTLLGVFVYLSALLFIMGFVYGPLGGWLPHMFPTRVRYTGASITFNVAGVLGGGLTPLAAQSLAAHGGLTYVGYYVTGLTAISLLALTTRAARA
ncbi:MFS transporter [Sphingomonas sp.]|uniref:MFS transporter n=1 Tax=Sphingomonas sp. TaxID=28214 RepID=UPI000DB485AF|nr:MFS transporter [Sphingomonas sp.]PZU09609.1 MAG: MFS transporter [Sphingomonas sp.]